MRETLRSCRYLERGIFLLLALCLMLTMFLISAISSDVSFSEVLFIFLFLNFF